jgi:hypothetical protein
MRISEKWVTAAVFSIYLVFGDLSTSRGADRKTLIELGRDYDNAVASARQRVNNAQARVTASQKPLLVAQSKLNSLRKPATVDNVKRLRIGEFETNGEFRQRVERTRASDQQATTAALKLYERRKLAAQSAVDQAKIEMGKQLPVLTRELTNAKAAYKSTWQSLPSKDVTVRVANLQLPRFDRDTMSFGPILIGKTIRGGVWNDFDKAKQNAVHLQENYRLSFSLSSPSLNQAKIFKEGIADGTITLTVTHRIQLRKVERPFTVKRDVTVTEEKIDWGTRSAGFIILAINQALGGQPPPPGVYNVPNKKVKRVVTKEETINGARYHYEQWPLWVVINKNKNGAVVTEVKLTNIKLIHWQQTQASSLPGLPE